MLPTDAVIDCPTVIAFMLDCEGITEFDPLMEGVRFALGQRTTDAAPDKMTAMIADVIDLCYGRPDLSNIEWGLLLDAISEKVVENNTTDRRLEGSDLEFR